MLSLIRCAYASRFLVNSFLCISTLQIVDVVVDIASTRMQPNGSMDYTYGMHLARWRDGPF